MNFLKNVAGSGISPAPWGRRLAALALDAAGIALVGWVFSTPIFRAEDALGLVKFSSIDTSAAAVVALILPLRGAAWIYPLSEAFVAATPGKFILGLKIALRGAGPERRTLHDRISGTAVFRGKDLVRAAERP